VILGQKMIKNDPYSINEGERKFKKKLEFVLL